MWVHSFTYKKPNSISKRIVVMSKEPTTMYAGIDISELESEDQVLYVNEAEKLKSEYLEKLQELNESFDVKHRYRQFDPERMSDIQVENI